MSLSVRPFNTLGHSPKFGNKPKTKNVYAKNQENPVSQAGETMNLVKATFLGGLALGGRLLYDLLDDKFLWEHAGEAADKIVSKNHKNLSVNKQFAYTLGATAGLLLAGVSAFALIYTAFNVPKIKYDGKINTFTKTKEMDVFINSNEAEKGIYTELSKKAKSVSQEERNKLKTQYMKMQMVQNKVPQWTNYKRK